MSKFYGPIGYITQKEIEISNNILNLTNSYQQSNIVDISLSAAESIGIDPNTQPSIFSRIKDFLQKLNI